MNEPKDKPRQVVQAELDAAQADLEAKVGQLKDVVTAKIEKPKQALETAEQRFTWMREHPIVTLPIAFAAGALLALLRRG